MERWAWRYADDLLALCHSREQAEQVKQRLADWLAPRGLVFNDDKTQITQLDLGVDFLGFIIRRYSNGKLLTKPSNDALRRIRKRLSVEVKALRGSNADTVIAMAMSTSFGPSHRLKDRLTSSTEVK